MTFRKERQGEGWTVFWTEERQLINEEETTTVSTVAMNQARIKISNPDCRTFLETTGKEGSFLE